MNIYVGNLDFKVNESDLEGLFESYGNVSSAKVIVDKFSGRSKGFGFVTMDDDEEAQQAIKELNGSAFQSRDIIVNEARPKRTDYDR
ncbi:MAG: RNA-binding protein [Bacteroidales bacterium]|jgi:RNA recognition motif-containing protein|nr:RNA-binding protein [Bacteroidales bacterium]NCU36639.1 RNA-binding protein [Candidatus Falkowbacteria bacterium]MDD3131703.1 RNA-binding protein [Bacteroidales bacterium]MDD3526129.1 RNA-binding protein [Bacteroidales bacterium]MDD4176260.1 RNA-binding protein [Bacteroidales bacterium]